VVREAKIDRRWRVDDPNPTRIRIIPMSQEYTSERIVAEIQIMAGGEHILLIFMDGEVETRSVSLNGTITNFTSTESESGDSTTEVCFKLDTSENAPEFAQHFLFMPGEFDGFLVLELHDFMPSDHQ
jgi:hypothetical protein